MLAGSGVHACARSLEKLRVLPDFRKLRARPEMEAAPGDLAVASKEDVETTRMNHIREQYDLLRKSLAEPKFELRRV
jgi:hypothetical protein